MEKLIINGGRSLCGSIDLQGSKNSILPILAATLITGKISVLHNCPVLTDVDAAIKILLHLGCKVSREGHTLIVDSGDASGYEIPDTLMHEMRSSIIFLGAMLARFRRAKLTAPGGCEIGLRPIDLHLSSFRKMGVSVEEAGGCIECRNENGIKSNLITLNFPSVGATENIMLAAVNAEGETVITNAAREPEITDLAEFLNSCGAEIHGAGESAVRIIGVRKFSATEHTVIPDRIVASTYMAAAACTQGDVSLKGVEKEHLAPVIPVFETMGCDVSFKGDGMRIRSFARPERIKLIRTMPYPGFPTDSQALVMAVAVKANGTSVITEKIFENRFRHAPELIKMGADIRVEDACVAVVEGVKNLYGANVTASDLRGGGALAVAALGAHGETVIDKIYHIDRGYEALERNLSALGADIVRR